MSKVLLGTAAVAERLYASFRSIGEPVWEGLDEDTKRRWFCVAREAEAMLYNHAADEARDFMACARDCGHQPDEPLLKTIIAKLRQMAKGGR